jgi:Co/Zn/Cd efflux system component
MDAVHNFSDELALLCLLAAYVFTVSLSRGLRRIANLLNSVGLIAMSTLLVWQAIDCFELVRSSDALLWPTDASCPHDQATQNGPA